MNVLDIVDAILDEFKFNPIRSHCTYENMPKNALFAYCSFLTGMACDSGGHIVEIGTDVGMSALSLAYGASLINNSIVYSFDIRPECLEFVDRLAKRLNINNLQLKLGTSNDVSKYVKGDLGIGYIDGEHDFRWCLTDLRNLHPLLSTFGKLLLHDFPVPLRGWEDKINYNGVGHACLSFADEHPEVSFAYLGASWICASAYHQKAWDLDLARSYAIPALLKD